ncbi:MAG: aminotransferase class I/II-fold pyridoxal phosphate-dependent enzyme [Ruminiclostridium sp.]|nr:aminotransferase class I/II-fold pyridoxal phosphate-dependent enzyme [Ruminiclostridium sp.]
MQGLILAAGMGKRLKELTRNNTKCMVQVNGVTLIERVLRQLDKLNLSRVIIVIGYEGQKLVDYIETLNIKTEICYVENKIYDKTNNIYSLALAKNYLLEDDTLLLESDLIFEDAVLDVLLNDPRETLALVDKYESWMDGTCVTIGDNDTIETFIPGKKFVFEDIPDYYKTVNIYKFSKSFSESRYVPFLNAYSKALGNNEYYEQVLRVITMLDDPEIKAKKLDGELWYEIDDIQDLDIASSMFAAEPDDRVKKIQNRYGGYWRYPHLLDFCYLVNPYYPPRKLMDEIKANLDKLITQYPSGMSVNSLLAAKNFGVFQEHILVGNGAAELIKSIMEKTTGRIGFIKPTFEEYPNRYNNESVIFVPDNTDLSYTAKDLMDFYADKNIGTLVLINPDNPSGNYIPYNDLLSLIKWCSDKNIRIIVDESFCDFADEGKTLINEDVINQFRNLIIIKSISKSYGVPGLRLGILVSADNKLVSEMKKDVAIWNINSIGEFYMQIAEKYNADYTASLEKLRNTRRLFVESLSEIQEIRVIPSQANYLLVELTDRISATELTKKLLINHNILIKDLTGKSAIGTRQYVRIAIRDENDNDKLVQSIKIEMAAL